MTKTITIYGIDFPVASPYAEGHVVTEAEAKALNQVRAENIGNNMRAKVRAELAEDGSISQDALEKLLALFADYDANYVFTLASVGGGRKVTDPVEAEARRMAKAAISAKLKSQGRALKEVDPDALAAAIAKLAEDPKIRKAAEKAVKERNDAASIDLAGLAL